MNGLSRSTLALVFLLASALAARFATFSVEPFGTQRVNLDTGVTTLPQGGGSSPTTKTASASRRATSSTRRAASCGPGVPSSSRRRKPF